MRRLFALIGCIALAPLAQGCENVVRQSAPEFGEQTPAESSGDGSTGPDPASCGRGPAQMRLLTADEFDHAVADLFGDERGFGQQFPGQPVVGGFENNASALQTSELMVESLASAAEAISARVADDLATYLPCAGDESDACARTFISEQGERVFRRPVTAEEQDRLFEVFETGKEFGFNAGIEFVLNTMLQSPSFLYRSEALNDDGRFEPYSMASRLSFFLWGSTPDDELLAAARSGALNDDEEVTRQAERMMEDNKARRGFNSFARQWLELDSMEFLSKNPQLYPEFDNRFRELWSEQLQRFVEYAVFDDTSENPLFEARYTFANQEFAELYGLEGPTGSEFERVTLNQGKGLLAQPGVLALHAHDYAAIYRGEYILTEILCTSVPPPPDILEIPVVDGDLPEREYVDALTSGEGCNTCHQAMNPMGHALGNYDGLGRYSETDSRGFAVDARSNLLVSGETIPVDGAEGMMSAIADRPESAECLTTKVFRFALGRTEVSADACALDSLASGFDGNMKELMVAVATHDSFTHGEQQQ